MRTLVLLFLLFSVLVPLSAQHTPALFKYEIGVDGAPFVHGDVGASLIFKHAIGPGKSAQKRHAVRLWGGYYRENIGLQGSSITIGDSLIQHISSNGEKWNALVSAGWERQFMRRRWRLYFGADAGYRYSLFSDDNETRVTRVSTDSILSRNLYQGEVRTHSVQITPFLGAQYFISPRFSLGLEAGVDLGLDNSRTDLLREGEVYFSDNSLSWYNKFRFVRLLYASWHFGKMATAVPASSDN